MGCDIHLYTEIKHTVNNKEIWVNSDNWKYNPQYIKDNVDGEYMLEVEPIYTHRNYELFSVLADVRNGGDMKYIVQPRGIPEDVSEITKVESDKMDSDGHSHSWLTLQELINYQKENVRIKRSGMITLDDAEKLDKGEGTPEMWSEWTSPTMNWVYREWEEEYDILKPLIDSLTDVICKLYWCKKLDDRDDYKLSEMIRIVFFFDN